MEFMPTILTTSQDENTIKIDFFLQPDLYYFQGHFPDVPILAGVVQIHWAVNFAKQFFNMNGYIKKCPSIKFMNILTPGKKITLLIEQNKESAYINFTYFDNEHIYSKGCLYYNKD
ncbi:MAG: hypothetical protein CNLJKLNK_00517 [Holosporales bacterium]